MEEQKLPEPKKKFNIKNSYGLKLIIISILLLLMLIPLTFINEIIDDRDNQRQTAITDIVDSMGGEPHFKGVILRVPYIVEASHINSETKENIIVKTRHYAYLTAEKLYVNGYIEAEMLTRGIYSTPVIVSDMSINGSFNIKTLNEELADYIIEWDNIDLICLVGPLRTIGTITDLNWENSSFSFQSGEGSDFGLGDFLQTEIVVSSEKEFYNFNFDLNLKGGRSLSFIPTAGTETISIESNWSSPSFYGAFLPSSRNWSEDGFDSVWLNSSLSNSIPRIWFDDELFEKNVYENSYGIRFMQSVNSYSQSKRSSKYGFLFLLVPFLTFFLFEVLLKVRIHPIQYLLAGAADLVFYLLLVSISEHMLFNYAYLISASAIIFVLGAYSLITVGFKKKGWIMSLVLTISYLFLFITLQQEDYALLYGSIGLLFIISVIMFITRKIKWYNTNS